MLLHQLPHLHQQHSMTGQLHRTSFRCRGLHTLSDGMYVFAANAKEIVQALSVPVLPGLTRPGPLARRIFRGLAARCSRP